MNISGDECDSISCVIGAKRYKRMIKGLLETGLEPATFGFEDQCSTIEPLELCYFLIPMSTAIHTHTYYYTYTIIHSSQHFFLFTYTVPHSYIYYSILYKFKPQHFIFISLLITVFHWMYFISNNYQHSYLSLACFQF